MLSALVGSNEHLLLSRNKSNPSDMFNKLLTPIIFFLLLALPACVSCQRNSQITEQTALQQMRDSMLQGKFPSDDFLAEVERRFANTQVGALTKLLRAYALIQQGNPNLAAEILDTKIIGQKTTLEDYRLWLRGKALKDVGKYAEALDVLQTLIKNYPDSLRLEDARFMASESALQIGRYDLARKIIEELIAKNHPRALFLNAQSYELSGDREKALKFYRLASAYGIGTDAGSQADAKITMLGEQTSPQTQEEALIRAERLFEIKRFADALKAYDDAMRFAPLPASANLKRLQALVNLKRTTEAQGLLGLIPEKLKEQAYYHLALGYASSRQWDEARRLTSEMLRTFPKSNSTAKTLVEVGLKARDAKNKAEARYYFQLAVTNFPELVEVAKAQFELAWFEHEAGNFAVSSRMFIEHLARYVDKDNSFRGRAGYWAARDAERAGRLREACAIYDAVIYRYSANWYGYLAVQRLNDLKKLGRCSGDNLPQDALTLRAIENLKTVTISAETATQKEEMRLIRSDQLSMVGLFDWAMDELQEASKSAPRSPKINLAIAKLYRVRNENANALLALARSYPDYSQMFPEEMSREEWAIFYPLEHWDRIKFWARQRNLDPYQVAGLIRQESVFNVRAKSSANAYGLMQLLIPTARNVARKYGISAEITEEALYEPDLNICLGTAYLRDMLDRFGRIEYAAAAYNAGPLRIPQWKATLPTEIDEFVESIPFNETRGYVQGVIRNTAQYRRLYDENGNFRPNVGAKIMRERVVQSQQQDEQPAVSE